MKFCLEHQFGQVAPDSTQYTVFVSFQVTAAC